MKDGAGIITCTAVPFSSLLFLITFYVTMITSTLAQTPSRPTLYCAHPQVCFLLKTLWPMLPVALAKKSSGHHHHNEPSVKEVKQLLTYPLIIWAPDDLDPWSKRLITQRSTLTNILSPLPESILKTYQDLPHPSQSSSLKQALSHFWLYPDVMCQLRHDWKKQFDQSSSLFKQSELPTTTDCPFSPLHSSFKELQQTLQTKKPSLRLLVLFPPIVPLLQSLQFPLLSVPQRHQPSPQELKEWILEVKKQRSSYQLWWIVHKDLNHRDPWTLKAAQKDDSIFYYNFEEQNADYSLPVLENFYKQLKEQIGGHP
jgi:hypothetical protein